MERERLKGRKGGTERDREKGKKRKIGIFAEQLPGREGRRQGEKGNRGKIRVFPELVFGREAARR